MFFLFVHSLSYNRFTNIAAISWFLSSFNLSAIFYTFRLIRPEIKQFKVNNIRAPQFDLTNQVLPLSKCFSITPLFENCFDASNYKIRFWFVIKSCQILTTLFCFFIVRKVKQLLLSLINKNQYFCPISIKAFLWSILSYHITFL